MKKKTVDFGLIGPGIVLAAAGVGAGDVVASGVAGGSFGVVLLWALLVGALFKYFLNEGMARYQLGTGKTFMEGFSERWKGFTYYFIVYLVIWSFIVGGALLSSVGLVSEALFPVFSLIVWAIIWACITLAIVITGNYKIFERVMKFFAFLMFLGFLYSAIMVFPSLCAVLKGMFVPIIPVAKESLFESVFKVLALMGGVGGTVTIMAYSYWIREKKITSPKQITLVRIDLLMGYIVTFIFGASVMVVSAMLINTTGGDVSGKQGIIDIGRALSQVLGSYGFYMFIIGFWAACISSLMSFYQAIPYLFADAVRIIKGKKEVVTTNNKWYKGYMIFCFLPPMILLSFKNPVSLILIYTVLGAFFMPFLALMLLIIGNEKGLGKLKNTPVFNLIMVFVFLVMTIISFWPLIQ